MYTPIKGRVWITFSESQWSGEEYDNVSTWRDNGQTFSELAKAQNVFQARTP